MATKPNLRSFRFRKFVSKQQLVQNVTLVLDRGWNCFGVQKAAKVYRIFIHTCSCIFMDFICIFDVIVIVHESLFTTSAHVQNHSNNAPLLLLQERDVSRKLWSIELLHHFKDSLQHKSQIGQENVQIRLPAVPWGSLQSHTLAKQFSLARMCSCAHTR